MERPSHRTEGEKSGQRERASMRMGEQEFAGGGGEVNAAEAAAQLASLRERLSMVKSEIAQAEALPSGMGENLLEGLRKRETDLTQTITELERPTIN